MIKRVSLSLLAIGLVSLLVTAGSLALFTASTSNNNNTFTAGEVSLGTPASGLVNVDLIVPGDSDVQAYSVEYTGNVEAWLGLDTTLAGGLTTCSGGGKFAIDIFDGAKHYSASMADQVIGKVAPHHVVNLTAAWSLDLSADDTCQGESAQLSLLVKAVQARNNTNATDTAPLLWN